MLWASNGRGPRHSPCRCPRWEMASTIGRWATVLPNLWNSATWEMSEALLSYLPTVMAGPEAWDEDETIRRAIEIHNGVIQNPKILSFQNRSPEYPPAPSPKSVGQPVVGDRLVVLAGHDVIDDLGRIAQRVVHRALLD